MSRRAALLLPLATCLLLAAQSLPAAAAPTGSFVQAPGDPGAVVALRDRVAGRAGGAALAPLVVGGAPAAPGSWPAAVSPNVVAGIDGGDDLAGHVCGGTLIAATWVLTAAHCVESGGYPVAPGHLEVVAGRLRLREPGGSRHGIAAVHVAGGWDPASLRNDLALLRLSTPVPVAPARLFGPDDAAARPPASGTTGAADGVTVLGWGSTAPGYGEELLSDPLLQLDMPLWSAGLCAAGSTSWDEATQVCAGPRPGDTPADSCRGDSGGPLVRRAADGSWRLLGVVSYGALQCATPGRPGYYTWVPAFAEAIAALVPSAAPGAAPPPTAAPAPAPGHAPRRLAGATRYETAARISADAFAPGVPVAFVATGSGFPDALGGGAAAAALGGPVLLTDGASLPPATREELTRLQPARIAVLGGAAAVSEAVVAELSRLAPVERVAGDSRYATIARLSARTFPAGAAVADVATGADFPDALGAAAAAGADRRAGPADRRPRPGARDRRRARAPATRPHRRPGRPARRRRRRGRRPRAPRPRRAGRRGHALRDRRAGVGHRLPHRRAGGVPGDGGGLPRRPGRRGGGGRPGRAGLAHPSRRPARRDRRRARAPATGPHRGRRRRGGGVRRGPGAGPRLRHRGRMNARPGGPATRATATRR